MLLDTVRDHPQRLALDDGRSRRSFAELHRRSLGWAQWLRQRGLQPGQRLGLLCGNRVEAVEVVLGGLYAGLWVAPVNWHLTAAELRPLLAGAGLAAVIVERRFAGLLPDPGACHCLEDVALPAAAGEGPDLDQPAGGIMLFTGGTTGIPRGVQRAQPATLGEQLRRQAAAGRQLGLDGSGPHLVVGPLYHAAPFLFALYDLYNGATVHILPRFDALAALQAIERLGIAHTHFVPTQLVRCLRLPAAQRAAVDLSSLRLVLHGAAPISPAVKRAMIAWWGPRLVEYWGGTESGVVTLCDSASWLRRPGSVGRPLPHWQVAVLDEDGRALPAGAKGLLYLRHRELARPFRYCDQPQATADAFREPYGFSLGDYGSVDEAGHVTVVARRSNLIIRGGVNIYPAEIEAALLEHPAVADAVVFGLDDPEWGSSVNALVAAGGAATDGASGGPAAPSEADLRAFLAERLARFKLPQRIRIVGSIARNPAGKVGLDAAIRQFRGG